MMKPCSQCGEVHDNKGPLCPMCAPSATQRRGSTPQERGYDEKWKRLSVSARRRQPFCSDCGSTQRLTVDHLPIAWEKHAMGVPITLSDVEVVCNNCNVARGSSRPGAGRI